jgi:hypothetical protein
MSFASWLRFPKFSLSALLTAIGPQARRQPTRCRLHVEMLEDRRLLSAGSSNQLGVANNPTINFNTQVVGLTLPQQNGSNSFAQNGVQLVAQPMNLQNAVSLTTLSNLLAQGQAYGQFRALGVNSQGQGNDLQSMQQLYLMTAMGFGSGQWPNRPWVPAAYNLGLANHQFGYSSQSDLGFMTAPTWTQQYDQQFVQQNQLKEQAAWIPEHLLIRKSMKDHRPNQINEDTNVESKALKPPIEEKPQESKPELKRGDPRIEEALFMDRSRNQPAPDAKRLLEAGESKDATPLEQSTGIPSALWLSSLAPAPLTALVAGLPTVEAQTASGEAEPVGGAVE